jgi:pimeloyl-ACP methyl ester carboxylesterase
MRLAEALADTYTVYVHDRRGRGLSGPPGSNYEIARECEDLSALLNKTNAHFVFGHSSGGLITLEAALTLPIHKLAVYEPSVSIRGSVPTAWFPAFEQAVAKKKTASAIAAFIKGLEMGKASKLPRWALIPTIYVAMRMNKKVGREMEELLPTFTQDWKLMWQLESKSERYRNITAEVLLLGGDKSPGFMGQALCILAETLPCCRRIELPGHDHGSPSEGAPETIARELKRFFAE